MFKLNWKYILYTCPFLLILAGWNLLVPLAEENLQMIRTLLQQSDEIASREVLKINIDSLKQANQKLQSRIDLLLTDLSDRDNLSVVYSLLNDLAAKHRVKIDRIVPRSLEKDTLFCYLPLEVSFHGPFPNLIKFLHSLEGGSNLIKVEHLTAQKTTDSKSELQVESTFLAYFKRE